MLAKSNRLTKEKDFRRVFRRGKRYETPLFRVYIGEQKESLSSGSRFGVIVSKKVSKKAVDRNRIKRVIRAAIKEYIEKTKGNFDIIIVVIRKPERVDFSGIVNTLFKIFKKAKLI